MVNKSYIACHLWVVVTIFQGVMHGEGDRTGHHSRARRMCYQLRHAHDALLIRCGVYTDWHCICAHGLAPPRELWLIEEFLALAILRILEFPLFSAQPAFLGFNLCSHCLHTWEGWSVGKFLHFSRMYFKTFWFLVVCVL